MRITRLSLFSALASCALTLGILHHLRARKEGEYWWLREQNDRMRYQAYQRNRSTKTPPATADSQASAPETQSLTPPADTSTGAQYGYHNAGLGSPAAALQTFVWACDRVDTAFVADMLTIEQAEHSKAEAFLAAQPKEVRDKWGTVEKLAANLLVLSTMGDSFPSSEVLAASPVNLQGDDRAICGAVRKATFRRVGNDWKYELSSEQLEKLYHEITQVISTPPAR